MYHLFPRALDGPVDVSVGHRNRNHASTDFVVACDIVVTWARELLGTVDFPFDVCARIRRTFSSTYRHDAASLRPKAPVFGLASLMTPPDTSLTDDRSKYFGPGLPSDDLMASCIAVPSSRLPV